MSNWTQTPPTEQGTYWHWNGDADSAPVPIFVLWSGTTGKCFVSRGQLGMEHATDCDEYGGWWMPLPDPKTPDQLELEAIRPTPPNSSPAATEGGFDPIPKEPINEIIAEYFKDDQGGACKAQAAVFSVYARVFQPRLAQQHAQLSALRQELSALKATPSDKGGEATDTARLEGESKYTKEGVLLRMIAWFDYYFVRNAASGPEPESHYAIYHDAKRALANSAIRPTPPKATEQ